MMDLESSRGFSLAEMLVSLGITVVLSLGLATLFVENSRVNRSQTATAEVQANARNTLSVVMQALRSAGWDPALAGIPPVLLDPDPGDDVDQIEIFADFDADGLTDKDGEQLLIRHSGHRVEWRRTPTGPFVPLAVDIGNDSDGDGVREPMFTAFPDPNPTRIRVQVTSESRVPDPTTGLPIRYTIVGDVALRKTL